MDWIEKFGHEVVRINEDCQIINITSSFYESENNFTFVLNDGRRIMRNFFHPKYIYSEQYLFNKDTFLQSVFNHR